MEGNESNLATVTKPVEDEAGAEVTATTPDGFAIDVEQTVAEQPRLETKVKEGEVLNILGMVLKNTVDKNLQDPKKSKGIQRMEGTLVVKASDADMLASISFKRGDIQVQNGALDNPTVHMTGSFTNLAKVNTAQIGPIRAMLTRKVTVKGNPLKALRMSGAIIRKEDGS